MINLRKNALGLTLTAFVVTGASTILLLRHSSRHPADPFGEELKQKVPGVALPVEAVEFLGAEGEHGKLPGIAKGDRVAFMLPGTSVDTNGLVRSEFGSALKYPLTVTVDANKNGQGFLYHYTLERSAKDGPWKLKRAWHTDAAGRWSEDYPLR